MPAQNDSKDNASKDASEKQTEELNKKILHSAILSKEAKEHYEKFRPQRDFNINTKIADYAKAIKDLEKAEKTFPEFIQTLNAKTMAFTNAEIENFNQAANNNDVKFDTACNGMFEEAHDMLNNLQNFLKKDGIKYNFVDVQNVMVTLENKTIKNLENRNQDNLKKIEELKLSKESEQKIKDAINNKFEAEKKVISEKFAEANKAINREYSKQISWLNSVADLNRFQREKMLNLTQDMRSNTAINIGNNAQALQNQHETASYDLKPEDIALEMFPNDSFWIKKKEKQTQWAQNGFFFLKADLSDFNTEKTYNNAKQIAEIIKSKGHDSITLDWNIYSHVKLKPSEQANLKQIYRACIDAGFPPDKIDFKFGTRKLSHRPEGSKESSNNPPKFWEDLFSKEELDELKEKGKNLSKSSEEKQKEIWEAIQVKRAQIEPLENKDEAQLEVLNEAPEEQKVEVLGNQRSH